MNKKQWFVFGIGFIVLGVYMLYSSMAWGVCGFEEISDLICNNRKYAYAMIGLVSQFLGDFFLICGWLEPKDKRGR